MFRARFNFFIALSICATSMFFSLVSIAASVDPTRPFGMSGSGDGLYIDKENGYKLTSIIHGDGIHTAVINGKIYKMFDYVGEYRITAINSHSVILRNKSERRKLYIFNSKGFTSNVVETAVAK